MVKNINKKKKLERHEKLINKNYLLSNYIVPKINLSNLLSKLKVIGLKNKSIKSIESIFQKYKSYFFENSKKSKSRFIIGNKYFPKSFYEKKSVEEYIATLKDNNLKTKIKKRNILNKMLSEIKTGNIKIRNKIKFPNDYEYCEIIKNEDMLNIVENIFYLNDINLILLYQMSFELGLSLSQIAKLKFRHIKNNFKNILFKDKGVQIYRVLSFYSYSLIKYHKQNNLLNQNDYLLFSEISNYTKKIRYYICEKKIDDLFRKFIKSTKVNKKKFLGFIKSGPKRKKINSINSKSKNSFFKKIWVYLNIFSNEDLHKNNKPLQDQANNSFYIKNAFINNDDELWKNSKENILKDENLNVSQISQINSINNNNDNIVVEGSELGSLDSKNLFHSKEDSLDLYFGQ